MSKRLLALAVLLIMLFAVSCDRTNDNDGHNNGNGGNNNGNGGYINEEGNTVGGNGVEERNADGEFFYRGVVRSVDERYYISMEIIDSNVAFGIYHANVDGATLYFDAEGNSISRESIKVGDTIEVVFSGQVMLSMPPQIYAQKIILK